MINTPEKKRGRSKSHPGYPLDECIDLVNQARSKLGTGPYDRDAVAEAAGASRGSGAINRKIAAAVHFGLFSRDSKGYSISSIAHRILVPLNETERTEAIREAFLMPALYGELITEFQKDGRIPDLLENTLVRKFKIEASVAKHAALVFRTSGEFSGVIDADGNISNVNNPLENESQNDAEVSDDSANSYQDIVTEKASDTVGGQGMAEQSFRLALAKNRFAILSVPSDLTENDVQLLQMQLRVLELQVKLGAVPEENEDVEK